MNTDVAQFVHERTSELPWVASSRSGVVSRRRVFRLGGEETGRVTSVARLRAGSTFPEHAHPEGEEIFVLSGVFSDCRGDHRKGVFLLNPEGFDHAPSSVDGCTVFVRLRQYPGKGRPQKAVDTNTLAWDTHTDRKLLVDDSFEDPQYLQRVRQRMPRSIPLPPHGLELFVVTGNLTLTLTPDHQTSQNSQNVQNLNLSETPTILGPHDWLRIPPETAPMSAQLTPAPGSDEAVVLVKENSLLSSFADFHD